VLVEELATVVDLVPSCDGGVCALPGAGAWRLAIRHPVGSQIGRRAWEPVLAGPDIETARPRIEARQGEVFYTKTGKSFTYRTGRYTLVIVETGRNVQRHEIRSALEKWPIAGPSRIP
jgi:hypothetical protein